MLTDYYKQELKLLKDIAREYSQDNAALNHALVGANADPDVVRILEGVAFLTANIRQELDSQFPQLLQSLAQLVCPQYIRPIPSATIMAFEPKPSIAKAMTIEAGTYVDSKPTENGVCRFKTTENIELLPIKLKSVTQKHLPEKKGDEITLRFELINQTLDALEFDNIKLYLGGDYGDASDLYYLLLNNLTGLTLRASGESHLNANNISAVGFDQGQSLLPQPKGVMPAFDLIQQYFLCPQKFLFVNVNLKQWRNRGAGTSFELSFICNKSNIKLPTLTRQHFQMYAAPAVNLFGLEAQSVLIDPKSEEYQIMPTASSDESECQIYSVDAVKSQARGMTEPREYHLFGGYAQSDSSRAVYELIYRNAPNGYDKNVFLKLAFPKNNPLEKNEILKASLTCSNGKAAEKLLPGDICVATSNTPELATFSNVTVPTVARRIPLDGDILWQLISHLSMNYLSITNGDTLKSILQHYIAPDYKDKANRILNEKKVEAITSIEVAPAESLFANAFVHGQSIHITIKSENFQSPGDKYLFGSVLSHFFAGTAAMNVFSELAFEDFFSGECIEWPAQLGNRPLQ